MNGGDSMFLANSEGVFRFGTLMDPDSANTCFDGIFCYLRRLVRLYQNQDPVHFLPKFLERVENINR
jgi:hypothetical protein